MAETRINPNYLIRITGSLALALTCVSPTQRCAAQTPSSSSFPSETPARFEPMTSSFGYTRREVMIPMRDGVKLHTVILIPAGARNAGIVLTRTPYDANAMTDHSSPHLGPTLEGYDNPVKVILEGEYIRVVQDVRGKYGSEGDYVMTRPLHGPLNPTPIDHSTDTYDTIDWLVKNISESNGRVGILGISYDGFLSLMALVNPHPALKVSVPMNPMVDGWRGDDWFHYGAFREQNMPYIYEQEASRDNKFKWWSGFFDDYEQYMTAGSAGELGKIHGLEQVGFWRKVLEHPSYDKWWQEQAMDKILAREPLKVPVMLVDSLWDQEDIYGAPAVYKAIKPKDSGNNMVYMVMGPWYHGQEIEEASTLGPLRFGSATGDYFQRVILGPFLAQYLKDGAPKADLPTVMAFETGTNVWRRLPGWPSGCVSGCTIKPTALYLRAGRKLSFASMPGGDGTPAADGTSFDEYVSDPEKPVPYRVRPAQSMAYDAGKSWSQWLVDDQRESSGRTDVLTYVSDMLNAAVKLSGVPRVNLVASTSGTDSDWVVKLIDCYADQVTSEPAMGGYQLMISADIFRGRYRESSDTAKPIAADQPLVYKFDLPNVNHVFLPGHRIMVQVQSSWFPLYDRNPQTFVPNIFWAKAEDYRKAVQRIYRSPNHVSFIELPLVEDRK